MVIVNKFMKYGHFITLSDPFSTKDIAQLFLDHFYKFHRMPIIIVTDKDKVFISFFFSFLDRAIQETWG